MNDLVNRLRGYYAAGPIQDNGEPEFGYRYFSGATSIQLEAADEIKRLRKGIESLAENCKLDAERYRKDKNPLRACVSLDGYGDDLYHLLNNTTESED